MSGQGPPKKESALELSKLVDKGVRVKLNGGREVIGILKGYDQMLNLVLDETTECLRGHQNIFEGFHASPVHDPEGLEPLIVI